ncbi:MAG TPA: M20/M25/M40 family metallo-hydrolase [Candidatus Rifleibacterium sp.]|nr:M20/M25/M40 family metallo-hydrolase [Candidatus Rifleibacterium sp.]HPT46148.1 M20/M25/M40 family metallo-hydrolase [Candidatus Rifleibacterium sp.]
MDGLNRIMLQDLVEKVNELCDNSYEACLQLLTRLIACKSLSGNEAECAEVLVSFFNNRNMPCLVDSRGSVLAVSLPRSFNAEPPIDMAKDGGAWLLSQLDKARDQGLKILAFNAHLDVVGADNRDEWRDDPFKAIRKFGRIFGRGACDMKGALAAMSFAIAISHDLDRSFGRQCVLLGCFCTEEEVAEGLAFKELCEEFSLKPDMVLLGEPSKMQIARGQRGKLEMLVETTGTCAHTSVPETGENAAYKLAKALLAIENFDAEERFKHGLEAENILKRTTMVAAMIESWPKSKSFVPNHARAHVTARLALDETLVTVGKRLIADENWPDATIRPIIYDGKSYKGRSSEWKSEHPAWETSADHPFFHRLSGAFKELFDNEPVDKIWPFSTDGVYSAGMAGIPTLGIGPGNEEVAHKNDEWVAEEELKNALKLYTFLAFYKP